MAKINKIQLDGTDYDIRGLIPEVVQSLPVAGDEDTLYLVEAAEPGTKSIELTGDAITVDGVPADAPFALDRLNGNTEQKTLSGKNVFSFDIATLSQYPATGIDIAIGANDITMTATGTTGAQVQYATFKNMFDSSKTYTLSGKAKKIVKGTDGQPWLNIYWRGSNDGGVSWSGYNNAYQNQVPVQGTEYTFDSSSAVAIAGYTTYQFLFYNNASNPVSAGEKTTYYDIQLEQNAQATSYEPYCGGIPSPNPDYPQTVNVVSGEQTVQIVGKNLVEDILVGGSIGAGGNIGTNASYQMAVARVMQGQTYTMTVGEATNVYGFFTSKPTIGSTSYDNSRVVDTNHPTITAPINGYIAFRTLATYTTPQLEIGDQATEYEPYQGQSYTIDLDTMELCKIGNYQDYIRKSTGKNLFDRANATENKVIIWASGNYNAENKTIISDYISASEGQRFSSNYNACILFYDNSKTYLGSLQPGGTTIAKAGGNIFTTFTIPSGYGVAYIRVEFRTGANSSLDMTQQNIMLNHGSTATDYEPYGHVWYKHAEVGKVVLDGTESWTSQASNNGYMYRVVVSDAASNPVNNMSNLVSDYFTPTSGQAIYSVVSGGYMAQLTVAGYIRFNIGDTTDKLADFETWLSTHNTTVYYALETPTDTEITDAELVAQLEALLAGSLYEGKNNIFLIPSGGAQGTIELHATVYNPERRYDEYVWVDDDQSYELVGAAAPEVDDFLSLSSLNPVQNRTLTEIIGDVESILQILNNGNGV